MGVRAGTRASLGNYSRVVNRSKKDSKIQLKIREKESFPGEPLEALRFPCLIPDGLDLFLDLVDFVHVLTAAQ